MEGRRKFSQQPGGGILIGIKLSQRFVPQGLEKAMGSVAFLIPVRWRANRCGCGTGFE
jgi:hypothetical protein